MREVKAYVRRAVQSKMRRQEGRGEGETMKGMEGRGGGGGGYWVSESYELKE